MRSRTLSFVGMLLLALSLSAPAGLFPAVATALQDDESPLIEPADDDSLNEEATEEPVQLPTEEATQEEPLVDEPASGLELQLVDELGDGGQPNDLPREIVVGDSRFLFDRIVPGERQDLARVAQTGSTIAYAATTGTPFSAIYLSAPPRNEDELARYLPELLGTANVACPADNAEFGGVEVGGNVYLFAGVEPDLTPDGLQEVASSNGQPIYADPSAEQPVPELFLETGGGLQRFVLTNDGRPVSLAGSLALNGTVFEFMSDVSGAIDSGTLSRIGCAGPYPVFTSNAATEGDRFVRVGDRLLQFSGDAPATEAPTSEPAATPTEVPTEQPTEVPTEQPTQEPTEVPTEVPTEQPTEVPTEQPTQEPTEVPTEEPTTIPTEQPTQTPTAEPTEVPTVTPTEVPTEQPTETSTEVPTEAATEQPTQTPTVDPTAEPTQEPTLEPTGAPTQEPGAEDPTVAPTVTSVPTQRPQAPAIVPTLAPNVPPPPAVTAEPTITCVGSTGPLNDRGLPANLPSRIQYGGIAYAFASAQPPADAGDLTAIGCAGAFEVATSDGADRSEALYLRATGTGSDSEVVYRYEAGVTYDVEFEVTGRAQRIQAGDQVFQLTSSWVSSIYSSTTVILFVDDPEATAPDMIYAVNVGSTASGDVIGEYQRVENDEGTADDVSAATEGSDLQPDLTIEGVRYLLVNVYVPVGTTTNGFVTVFSASGEGEAELLLGRDLRRQELFLYTPVPSAPSD